MGNTSGGKSTQTSSNVIDPSLQPLFQNTAGIIGGIQDQLSGGNFFNQFFQSNPQQVPNLTQGQQNVLAAYGARAFGEPFNAYDIAGTNFANAQSGLNAQEQGALGAIPGISNFNQPETRALQMVPYIGSFNSPELQAWGSSGAFGDLTNPEQAALGQINRFTSGEIGQSPATQAAMAAVRNPVLQDAALAGLGNSDAVGSALGGAYAPILAQEMAIRAGVIPQLANIGAQQRGGAVTGAQLQSQLGGALRGGQQFGAGLQSQLGQALRGGQEYGANLQSQLGGAQRAAQQFAAQFLGNQGQQWDTRQAQNLQTMFGGEEAARQAAASQAEAAYKDFLRLQGLAGQYTTGILSGMPTISGSTVSGSTSGTKSGTVLCTELRRQGLMSWDIYKLDCEFGQSLPVWILKAYRTLANPLVRVMRRSSCVTNLVAPAILLWARAMAVYQHGRRVSA